MSDIEEPENSPSQPETISSVPSPSETGSSEGSLSTSGIRKRQTWIRRSFKLLIGTALILLCLGFSGMVFKGLASLKEEPQKQERVEKKYNVEVYDIRSTTLQEMISGFGTASADREVTLSAQVTGTVIYLKEDLKVGTQYEIPHDDVIKSLSDENFSLEEYIDRNRKSSNQTTSESNENTNSTATRNGSDHSTNQDERKLVLVEIDPTVYLQRYQQAQKRLDELDAEWEKLLQEENNNEVFLKKAIEDHKLIQSEFKKAETLFNSESLSEAQYNMAKLDFSKSEQALLQREQEKELFPTRRKQLLSRKETAKTDLKLTQFDLQRTKLRVPFTGTVSEVMIEEGQYVRPGEPLYRLTSLAKVEIQIAVTLEEYARVKQVLKATRNGSHKGTDNSEKHLSTGRPIVFLSESETSAPRWRGELVRIAPTADESTRTISVFIEVDNRLQSVPLLPGTFVHALITGPLIKATVAIPRDAILNGHVFVVQEGRAERRKVTIKRKIQTLAILEPWIPPATADEKGQGVKPGEQIIMTNLDIIHEGAKVEVQEHQTLEQMLELQATKILQKPLPQLSENPSESIPSSLQNEKLP